MITCKNCGLQASEDARYCPHCGTLIAESPVTPVGETLTETPAEGKIVGAMTAPAEARSRQPLTNPASPIISIFLGVAGAIIGIFLSTAPFIGIFTGIFAGLAIYHGIQSRKVQVSRRADWGLILGSVTAFLTVVLVIYQINVTVKANNLNQEISAEIGIEIPKILPSGHTIYETADEKAAGYMYFYTLNEQKAGEFLDNLQNHASHGIFPLPTEDLTLLEEITEKKFLDFPQTGYYLIYDRLNETYGVDLNETKHHYLLLIYDDKKYTITIYDIRYEE